MESNNKSALQSSMESGVFFGVFLVIMNIALYFFKVKALSFSGNILMLLIQLIVYFFFIYFYTKRYKERELEGFISYNQAFFYGIMLMFFSAIILSFFLFILNKYIDPDLAHKNFEQAKEMTITFMQKHGIPEDKIDSTIQRLDASGIPNAAQIAINNIFSSLILGLILSLISAAILKKTANPFDAEKQNNEF